LPPVTTKRKQGEFKMDFQALIHSELFAWVILPILIFLSRIVDVSIGTMRIIYVSRGMKQLATIFGFFEVLIWLIAITQVMQNLTNFVMYLTYAAGFAVGNYIGIFIENKFAVGYVIVRVITQKDANELVTHLRGKGYGVTTVDADGLTGQVTLVFTVVKRKDLHEVVSAIKQFNPSAFYSVEDVKTVSNGVGTNKRIFGNSLSVKKIK
jgi:uncharacterized protein YebE (UPF0316 family)